MRRAKPRSIIKDLMIISMIMFMVNLAVLRIFFDVRLSDIPLVFMRDSSVRGDISAEGDSPVIRDGPGETDGYAAVDASAESNYSSGSLYYPGDIENLIKELSLRDKIYMAYILSKVDEDGLNRIYDISQDGITTDEIAVLREYALENLDPSDVDALEEMFFRYSHLYSDISDR
jgi:hypothetical protein